MNTSVPLGGRIVESFVSPEGWCRSAVVLIVEQYSQGNTGNLPEKTSSSKDVPWYYPAIPHRAPPFPLPPTSYPDNTPFFFSYNSSVNHEKML